MPLDAYQRKRDFGQSPEPTGRVRADTAANGLRFVVQKHDARNLHYDFRLEHTGVLKSWAVPRGPSLNPTVKRLAVEVEDHPLEYAGFEGTIPEGHYGAGRVVVWDTGTWQPHGDATDMLRSGKLKFRLHGLRLQGDWVLVRTGMKGNQQQWLLTKQEDSEASSDGEITERFVGSVLSGDSSVNAGAIPNFIPPKLPTLTNDPPREKGWIHELKLDGYRMQVHWRSEGVHLLTRAGHDWTHRYQVVANELSKLNLLGTILDGELTAIDEHGKSNFDLLRQSSNRTNVPLALFAFDLLYSRGVDQRQRTLLERKAELKKLLVAEHGTTLSPRLQYLDHIASNTDALIEHCRALGLEGIVSKRIDRNYTSGRASDWLKTKLRFRENLVVVGCEISGSPPALSCLLVAYHDENDQLQFAGRVGTGWDEKTAVQILERLSTLATDKSSLASKVWASKRARNKDVSITWVQPVLVAVVDFASWTESKQVRQASLAGFAQEAAALDVSAAQLFSDNRPVIRSEERSAMPQPPVKLAQIAELPGLTHSDRVLFPADGITKADVATYLFQVNQWLLPHLRNRPVSLLRCSNGIAGETFFQRHPGRGLTSQISTLDIVSEKEPLLTIGDLQALLATAQINAIELHPWGCQSDDLEHPDQMIIDLDPDPELSWNVVVEAAFLVRSALELHELRSFVKTTGGKGLHVVVPLAGDQDWQKVFDFSKKLAIELEKSSKNLFVANMSKSRRRERIYVDYHRNRRGSTSVAAYSLRARAGATVSTPIAWDELPQIHPTEFTLRSVPTRLATINDDPWREMDAVANRL